MRQVKRKQHGSIHLILLGIVLALIIIVLTYVFLNNLFPKSNISMDNQPEIMDIDSRDKAYIEFKEWNIRFQSDASYDLKRNSATGNETAYFITNDELVKVCVSPESAWLGIIRRYENPEEKITSGQYSGQTPNQLFGKTGMSIEDKLYVFNAMPQSCTRGGTEKSKFDHATEKLEAEIKSLEAYH